VSSRRVAPTVAAAAVLAASCVPDRPPARAWDELLSGGPCAAPASELLGAWGVRDAARRGPPQANAVSRFRMPTRELGVWVEVGVVDANPPTLTRLSPSGTDVVSFGADCDPVATRRPGPVRRDDRDGLFTDDDLREALRTALRAPGARGVVVYVWSPHMPLSVDGYPEIRRAAEATGLRLEPVLFPDGSRAFAEEEALRVGMSPDALREAAAVELVARDALVHAPSIVLFTDLGVSPVLPGYRDRDGYVRFVEGFLAGR